MGDSDKIFFKNFSTNRRLGEILQKVDEMKVNWKAIEYDGGCNYNLVSHNCRNFAIKLGEFLINQILTLSDSYDFEGSRNVSKTHQS